MTTTSLATICLYTQVHYRIVIDHIISHVVVVQLLWSHVLLFVTNWTAACRASWPSLSPRVCSNSRHTESVMPPNHFHPLSSPLLHSCPQSFQNVRVFFSELTPCIRLAKVLYSCEFLCCILYPWLTYFITGNLYHFIPSHNFPYLPHPSPLATIVCSVYL